MLNFEHGDLLSELHVSLAPVLQLEPVLVKEGSVGGGRGGLDIVVSFE